MRAISKLFLCLMIVAPAALTGATASNEDLHLRPPGIPDAAWDDIQLQVMQQKMHVDQVIDRYLAQEMFHQHLDPLITNYPATYAEAGISESVTLYIYFKGEPPTGALALKELDIDVDVQGGARYSELEAEQWNAAIAQVLTSSPGGSSISWVDPMSGELTFASNQATSTSIVRSLAADLASGKIAVHDSEPPVIRYEFDESISFERHAVRGGDLLTYGSQPECTAAFPAKYGTSAGLLTAGHCINNLDADYVDNLYTASRFSSPTYYDAQWHKARPGVTVTPYFRYNWGSFRPVWAHPQLGAGLTVCRFGATTGNGNGCQQVWKVSACVEYDGGSVTVCGQSVTYNTSGGSFGDSGGPWYYGNNAYGVHTGGGVHGGDYDIDSFTRSRQALADLELTAMYGPR